MGKCNRNGTSVKEVGDSLNDVFKLKFMSKYVSEIVHQNMNIAEVGVYLGGSAKVFSDALGESGNIFLFDTFEGMPEVSIFDHHQEGDFYDTSYEEISNFFKNKNNVKVYKGLFPKETSHHISDLFFDVVHLDVDIYQSYVDCLEFFYPRLKENGIIFFDDYAKPSCPGATKAVDEFAEKNGTVVQHISDGEDTYWKVNDVYFIKK